MFIINPALADQINTNQTQLTQSSFTPQEINDIRNISSSIKKIHQQRPNSHITNQVSQILTQQTSQSYNNHAPINPKLSPQAISTPQPPQTSTQYSLPSASRQYPGSQTPPTYPFLAYSQISKNKKTGPKIPPNFATDRNIRRHRRWPRDMTVACRRQPLITHQSRNQATKRGTPSRRLVFGEKPVNSANAAMSAQVSTGSAAGRG